MSRQFRWGAVLICVVCSQFSLANDFAQCLDNLQSKAKQEGLPPKVVTEVFSQVKYVSKVIELDRQQPEFAETFANYLKKRVTNDRIKRGRRLLIKHKKLLLKLQDKYGVPPQYLLAFWGLETNHGRVLGKMPVFSALSTLACDDRRSDYFTKELFTAIRLIDHADISPQKMRGSWAGAMGHTQFMPSAYLRYAVDGNGDGAVDVWNIPDALTSAANFLQQLGWERGTRWGREVVLPKDFTYLGLGRNNPKPLTEWAKQGVLTTAKKAIPIAPIDGSLLLPSGHRGPAFLVYNNFKVIMKWNRSEYYALSVGHLADRINGAGQLSQMPVNVPRLSLAQVQVMQEKLNELGFNAGTADGILGSATREAIRAFQHKNKLIADGFPSPSILKVLNDSSANKTVP